MFCSSSPGSASLCRDRQVALVAACVSARVGLFALLKYGPDASVIIRLIVALVITALGVLVGAAIDGAQQAGENPRYA